MCPRLSFKPKFPFIPSYIENSDCASRLYNWVHIPLATLLLFSFSLFRRFTYEMELFTTRLTRSRYEYIQVNEGRNNLQLLIPILSWSSAC